MSVEIPFYLEFYQRSFTDLSLAADLSISQSRNNPDLLKYKLLFLQQSLEKLFKTMILNQDPAFNPGKLKHHNLRKLAKELSKLIGSNFIWRAIIREHTFQLVTKFNNSQDDIMYDLCSKIFMCNLYFTSCRINCNN